MKKVLSILLCSSIAPAALAMTPLSNIIIFGDSLSDTGNHPEASHALVNQNAPATLKNMQAMFYVPVSNPLNSKGYHIHDYGNPVPMVRGDHLPVQPTIQGHPRVFRSSNWAEFFMDDALKNGLLNSSVLLPWAQLASHPQWAVSGYQSVNYAWASATSGAECNYSFGFAPAGPCNAARILSARNAYLKNPSVNNYNKTLVPGLLTQVTLFQDDVLKGQVHVGPDTGYFIEIGGNDLLQDLIRLKGFSIVKGFQVLGNIMSGMLKHNDEAINTLITNPNIQAHHIFVVNLFNPDMTPAVYGQSHFKKDMITHIIQHYNDGLARIVAREKKRYPGLQITIIPFNRWMNYIEYNNKSTAGKACQLSNPGYDQSTSPKLNCKGYTFWNAVHPSGSTHQMLGWLTERHVANL